MRQFQFRASISIPPSRHFSPSFVRSPFSPSHGVPLLSPSESVASRRGVTEVLIGATLANGGSLEVAPLAHVEPAPAFALSRVGTKEMKRWQGAEASGGKKQGEIL